MLDTSKRVVIVGLGLLGGRYALGLTRAGFAVDGIDRSPEAVEFALKEGYIQRGATENFAPLLAEAGYVVLGLYPTALLDWLKQYGSLLPAGCLVTDTCGVKTGVVDAAQALMPEGVEFIGSHPMAGKERSGFDASEASLFYNASYILVPGEAPQSATDTLVSLAKSMGFGTIKYCTQQKHDRMIAYTSQIPHVLACAYVMSPRCDEHSGFSAGSYRDVSRVARINAELWADLFLANREELADETEELVRNIERIRTAVAKNDRAELVALLSSAREKKEKFG